MVELNLVKDTEQKVSLRSNNINKLKSEIFDVLVIGGGINGAVASAALSAKGSRVALVEKKDFDQMDDMLNCLFLVL